MEHGYAALRTLDDDCKVNLRYMYLMDWETPSYISFLSGTTSTNTATNSKDNRSQRSQRNLPVSGVRGTISFRTKLYSITSLVLSIRK